jgi:short-subunit dehydrogenase involved in D-alanine esterification of teichoic acids
MKISITGHTSGIGKSLVNLFESLGHEVVGFSRSNGYDISKDSKAIVEQTKDCDVFINNAYHVDAQLSLLKEVLTLWEGQSKTVLNISSQIIYKEDSPMYQGEQLEYKISKTKLSNFVKEYTGSVTIKDIVPALVDTDFYITPPMFKDFPSIKPDALAQIIVDSINNLSKEVLVDSDGTVSYKF